MWQRFTERARRVILYGQEDAIRMSSDHVGTEHLLLGLVRENEGVAAQVLLGMNIAPETVRREVEAAVHPSTDAGLGEPKLTPKAKRVLELAADEARRMRHNYIGTEHLLLALLREKDGLAATILRRLGLELENARNQVLDYLGPGSPNENTPSASSTPSATKQETSSSLDEQQLTTGVRIVVLMAQEEAQKRGSEKVTPEHLLLGLLQHSVGGAVSILHMLQSSLMPLHQQVEKSLSESHQLISQEPQLDANAHRILELASSEARLMKYSFVGTEHLLLALLRPTEGACANMLNQNGINRENVLEAIITHMNSR